MTMLSSTLRDALNHQINEEMQSSYLYLGMAAYFQAQNFNGFAQWMHAQAEEERGHAMRFYHYVYERGGRVELLPLSAPPTQWDSPLHVFQESYHHEQKISALIHDLMDLAV